MAARSNSWSGLLSQPLPNCRPHMGAHNSCLLFVPALETRFWRKLPALATDLWGVVIDLEDSIHPESKALARDMVEQHRGMLELLKQIAPHLKVVLRVNNRNTAYHEGDLNLANALAEDGLVHILMYPKTEQASEIKGLSETCSPHLALFPIIETLEGYSSFQDILTAEHRIVYTAIGAEDICADMNVERPAVFYDNPLLSHITATVALHAKRLGIGLWGNIWPYLSSTELLPAFYSEVLLDQQFGAVGKILFHPYQIQAVKGIFNSQYRAEAHQELMLGRLHAIARRSEEYGLTVAVHNARMVDMPELVRLRRWYRGLSTEKKAEVLGVLPSTFIKYIDRDD
ncbi:MAG: aldolase/citrate lyase family protein [Bacteroidota bacterium]